MKSSYKRLHHFKNKQNVLIGSEQKIRQMENTSMQLEGEQFNLKEFIINQNHLNNLFTTFLEYNLGPQAIAKNSGSRNREDCLIISNIQSKQRMTHGKEFKHLLDPRDRVLQHDFDFTIKIDLESVKNKGFLKSEIYQLIIEKIQEFLVETIANILSASFKCLSDQQLQEKEVKNYAASNLMLNLQSIYSKTIQALENSEKLKEYLNLKQVKLYLIQTLEQIVKNILLNQAAYYPQAPITGGTLRMNSAINEVNRVDDEENDLIFSNGIKISKYLKTQIRKRPGEWYEYEEMQLRKDEDYTEFIMEVVNSAIKVVQTCQGDSQQRINKQIFTQFNKELFALSQIQAFKQLLEAATNTSKDHETIPERTKVDKMAETKEKQTGTNKNKQEAKLICSYFERITQTDASKLRVVKENIQKSNLCPQINKQRQKKLQSLTDYAIGFKIPNYVKQFSRQQMAEKQFRAKHSSVLRILTKWAESLEDTFDNAEKAIMMRLYSFKDVHNKLISITDKPVKQSIVQRLNKEHNQLKSKLDRIKARNLELVSLILSEGKGSFPYNVYRFTQTRQVSSKINAILTSLMVEYISALIHHLLIAGKQIRDKSGVQFLGNLNLVGFKVSDLMRAKFKCSQSSFITLLKTMYLLDESKDMKGKFKLVRIKNKLQDSANNILINYLFMGKVLCELQLSIQESKKKEKNFYIFSHFIYELTRGNFGAISECAIMISQLDPIANSSDQIYYEQKKQSAEHFVLPVASQKTIEQKQKPKKGDMIFFCSSCKKLIIKEEITFNSGDEEQNTCRRCFFSKDISNQIIKSLFQAKEEQIQNWRSQIKRVTNYEKISGEQIGIYLRVNSAGKMELLAVVYAKEELKHFLIKISPQVLQKVTKDIENVDFSQEMDYVSIQKQIKHKKQILDHFLFKLEIKNINLANQLLVKMKFEPKGFQEQIINFIKMFNEFRKQKNLLKSIKFKAEILNFNNDSQKWQCFNRILKAYPQQENPSIDNTAELKYKKYKQLSFNKIKVIEAINQSVKQNNQQLAVCVNLEQIRMTYNVELKNVDFMRGMASIQKLYLTFNKLQNVEGLSNFTTIHTLHLSQNQLQSIDGLRNITSINDLHLNNNQLKHIDALKNITSINILDLKFNQIQNVDGLRNLITVNELDLRSNLIQNVDGLKNLRNVNDLDLRSNQLQNADALKNITKIKKLFIGYNMLQNVDGLQNITKIEQLTMGYNKLKNIEGLKGITSIDRLYLTANQLQNLDGLRNLTAINILEVRNNQLTNVDGLKNVTAIKGLELRFNQLQNIDGLINLRTVGRLSLEKNQISTIDPLKNITSIQELDLKNNSNLQISFLPSPSTILSMKVNYAQVKTFDFEALTSLKTLLTDTPNRQLYKNLMQKVQLKKTA